jgi:hypothetical protein
MIDLKQSEAFLAALGGGEFVFQTFTDAKAVRKAQRFDPLAKVLIGSFERHKDTLSILSSKGAGVFVQINAGTKVPDGIDKKRCAEMITSVRALWVDLDDPSTATESLAAAQQYMPRPSIVCQSSAGKYHLYWLISDCDLTRFKKLQQSLAVTFNGDSAVCNLDRVMRLPGFPHQKDGKQAVTCACMGGVHTLAEIHTAASKAPILSPAVKPEISKTNTASDDMFGTGISDAYEAPTSLPPGNRTQPLVQHAGYMISQGYSAQAVRDELISMNVELCPDDAEPLTEEQMENEVLPCIHSFAEKRDAELQQITNKVPPPPKDSELVNPPSLPVDPISDAQEGQTLDEWLARFLFVERDSRVIDTSKVGTYAEYTLTDFKNKTANIYATKRSKLFNTWFSCSKRQDVRDTIYHPAKEGVITCHGEKMWNLYSPSEVTPATVADSAKIKEFMMHMDFMFPLEKDRTLFLDWLATTYRHPEIRIPWAPFLISPHQGAGKGFIYEVLSRLLGAHNCRKILPDRLENQFNSFLKDSTLVCIDEMKQGQRYAIHDKLKSYISETEQEVNAKNLKEGMAQIFCNIIIFTNHSNAAFIEENDRRFWVHKVHGIKTSPYYKVLWDWAAEDDNIAHLMKWCIDRDLSKFNPKAPPPLTEAKSDMIMANKSEIELILEDAIAHREALFAADVVGYLSVKDYIEAKLNITMNSRQEAIFKNAFLKLSEHMSKVKEPLRPIGSDISAKQRIRCVRNHAHWDAATVADIRYEFTRSIQFELNPRKVMPPKIAEVGGDT